MTRSPVAKWKLLGRGIVFAGIPGDWYLAFLGVLLLAAVIVNNYIRQRATMTRH